MTASDFRKLALALPEAIESAHMGHPDFRVGGKIFATLAYPNEDRGMVKLTPEQQAALVDAEPEVFEPVAGGWGKQGATYIWLRKAKKVIVRQALITAWLNRAPERLTREFEPD